MSPETATLEEAVEDFLARRSRGEAVDPQAFVARHAALGQELASAIDALLALETVSGAGLDQDDLPDRVGPYRVVREIGRGGMGVVLEAVEEPLGRRVALKVLPAELLTSQSARARFRREAELAAKLDHSGIATIFGAGVDEARPWIAMRFVDGLTLARAIIATRAENKHCVALPGSNQSEPEVAVAICIAKVAHALHAAHEQGVVHRDVKPSNIIVAPDGAPVLLDFGLALPEEADGRSLTRTGETAGTPAYIAPEQLSGEHVRSDAQGDVYALGVTLYECLALRRPFEAPTPIALYRAIAIGSATNVRVLNRRVSRDLAVIVATAMERDRSRRYSTAAALAKDLEAAASGRPIAARPVSLSGKMLRWARREPRQAALVALLLVAVVGFALFGGTWWATRDEVHAAENLARERTRDEALTTGFVKLQTNDDDADSFFARALALDAGNLEAVAGRALVEVGRDHEEAALASLTHAPNTPGFNALRAYCRHEPITQDRGRVRDTQADALDLFLIGTCLSRQADRGPLSQQKPDQQRALAMLDEAIVRAPHARPTLHSARAIAAGVVGDEAQARSAVAALLVLWPDSPGPIFAAGMSLHHFDPVAARSILKRATVLAPADSGPCQVLANTYQQLGDPASAELWCWHAIARARNADNYNALGGSLYSRGCLDEAGEAWKRGFATNPDQQNALLNVGQWYYVTGDFSMAQLCLERLLEHDPDDAVARGALGMSFQASGDDRTARAHYERALESIPERTDLWTRLATVDRNLGHPDEGLASLGIALEINPGDENLVSMRAALAGGH